MRIMLADYGDGETIPVVYHGSVPDAFKAGREIVLDGTATGGVFHAKAGLARDEVPVEVHAGRRRLGPVLMATLGRGALILALLLGLYAAIAAMLGARSRDRRLILSSRRAVYALVGAVLAADAVFMARHRRPRLLVRDGRRDVVAQAAAALPGDLVLGLAARLAAALADRAGGFTGVVLCANKRSNRELMPWVTAILAGTCGVLRARCWSSPPARS